MTPIGPGMPQPSTCSPAGASADSAASRTSGPRPARPGSSAAPNRRAPLRGPFLSELVSRILSWAAIYLCGPPGPRRAGSTVLLGLAPGGVCLAAASPRRRCALTAPFHLCLYATQLQSRHRPCHFCGTFPRVSPGGRYPPPCPVVSGLSSRGFLSPRGRSARPPMVARRSRPGQDLDGAEDADHFAEDFRLGREDRLHFLVFGLEPDVVLLAEDPLHRRLLADQGNHDLSVGSRVTRPHDHVVAFEDAGVLHAFAADLEDVVAVLAADHVRDLEVFLDVLFSEDRRPGGHLADQGQPATWLDRVLGLVDQQLDRPWLRGIAPPQPQLLQVR